MPGSMSQGPTPDTQSLAHSMTDLPDLADDLFMEVADRNRQSRHQKRIDRRRYANVWGQPVPLDGGPTQLKEAQSADPSLNIMRKKCKERTAPFFLREGIMLRSWTPPHQKEPIDQVILPHGYREAVLRMAHMAPWAGHFGRRRTTDRILHRFFWPGVRQDVADLCRRCQTCQRTAQGTTRKVPLVPLPVISTPFTRIAMDMVGPLPVTDEGHKYILTIVDYGSRYPDAIPARLWQMLWWSTSRGWVCRKRY